MPTRFWRLLFLLAVCPVLPASSSGDITCGSWTTLSAPPALGTRALGNSAYDSARRRVVIFGGRKVVANNQVYMNDLWSFDFATSTWSQIAPYGTPPQPRQSAGMVYDPIRDRMIVFGGKGGGPSDFLNDTWELSLSDPPTWTQLSPAGAVPPLRHGHTMVYDSAHDRALVFGGVVRGGASGQANDVWALSLSGTPTWTQVDPAGLRPSPRWLHVAVYDTANDRMIVFGGETFETGENTDVWALSLDGAPEWSQLSPVGVGPSSGVTGSFAAYDPVRGQMILQGGYLSSAITTLSLDGPTPTWTGVQVQGSPPLRSYHFGGFDPIGRRLMVYGGFGFNDGMLSQPDVIDLTDGPTIDSSILPIGTGTVVKSPATLCHPPGQIVTVTAVPEPGFEFVDWTGSITSIENPLVVTAGDDLNLTAMFRPIPPHCGSWSLFPLGAEPGARSGAGAIYDAPRQRMLMFGGHNGATMVSELWALALDGGAWSQITPGGTAPTPRDGARVVYDPVRDRMLMFGGNSDAGLLIDIWELPLDGSPVWNMIPPLDTPPLPRSGVSLVYDSLRDRLLLFGGLRQGSATSELWELTLAGTPAWRQLVPATSPPVRSGHVAIYDVARDRMIVFGGINGSNRLTDTWALSLAGTPSWAPLAPSGSPPTAGEDAVAIHDAARDRMIVFGGRGSAVSNETFALDLEHSAWSSPSVETFPAARRRAAAVLDTDRDQMVLFGGLNAAGQPMASRARLTLAGGVPLQAIAEIPEHGTVRRLPDLKCYAANQTVTLVAEPASGYQFTGWLGDAGGTANPLTVSMSGPRTIIATFQFMNASCGGWTTITSTAQPGPAFGAAAIFDAPRQRMLMFGGVTPQGPSNDLWSLDPFTASWTLLAPSGAPSSREGAGWVYDSARDRILMFGGHSGSATLRDLYELPLGLTPAWQRLTAFQAPSRYLASLIYDPVRDRLLLFGGRTGTASYFADVWELPLAGSLSWLPVATTGSPPAGRYAHGAIYDPIRDRMVIFGGSGSAGGHSDTWALTLSGTPAWTALPNGSASSFGSSIAYDGNRDRMVVFGGSIGPTGTPTNAARALSFSTLEWSEIPANGPLPTPRSRAAAAFDPVRDELLMFGGQMTAGAPLALPSILSFASGHFLAATPLPADGGSIVRTPASACQSSGTEVVLHAVPRPGHVFTSWSGDASGSANPLTVIMDATKNIVAHFEPASAVAVASSAELRTGLGIIAPNPMLGLATIRYDIGRETAFRLQVLDLLGRRVTTLVSGRAAPGAHTLTWNGRTSEHARRLPAGIYFVHLEAEGRVWVRRVVLAR